MKLLQLLLPLLLWSCIVISREPGGWSLVSHCDDVAVRVGETGTCTLNLSNKADFSRTFRINPIRQPTTCGPRPFQLTTDRVVLPPYTSLDLVITFSPTWYPVGGECDGKVTVQAEVQAGKEYEAATRVTTKLQGRVIDRDDDCDGISVGTGDCFDRSDEAWCAWVAERATHPDAPPPPPDPAGVPQPHEIHPSAIESCNGFDDDCDGLIDDADDDRHKQPDSRVVGADGQPYDPQVVLGGTPFRGAKYCYADLDADGWPVPADPEPTYLCQDDQRGVICFDAPRTDGWDCNDEDRLFHPGAIEVPGEPWDLDCDGNVVCFLDLDGDDYGGFNEEDLQGNVDIGTILVPVGTALPCETDAGDDIAARIGDCNDHSAAVHPGAAEVCNTIDDDCDGLIDDQDDSIDPQTQQLWYADFDRDGSAGFTTRLSCADPSVPALTWQSVADDCDDEDPFVYPLATEICNGKDDDCVGGTDDQTDLAVLEQIYTPDELIRYTWWEDGDGDNYGRQGSIPQYGCRNPGDWVNNNSDCDDRREAIHPGAEEAPADRTDGNCDGQEECWIDADGDGHGALYNGTKLVDYPDATVDPCEPGTAENVARLQDDCADDPTESAFAAEVYPGQIEVCNERDDDCDHAVDQADPSLAGGTRYHPDFDGDGHGAPAQISTCDAPVGYVAAPAGYTDEQIAAWLDCDDARRNVHPGASEAPNNGLDDNCDGLVACFVDDDRDGWAATLPDGTVLQTEVEEALWGTDCAVIPGMSDRAGDCDDSVVVDATGVVFERPGAPINPEATEVCNNTDDDCDGATDDDDNDRLASLAWYVDFDGDGHGDPARVTLACQLPAGMVSTGFDCRDNDGTIHPEAPEWCNGRDDDCDLLVDDQDDDGNPVDYTIPLRNGQPVPRWYPDLDRDGHGDAAATGVAHCAAPQPGDVQAGDDCDDHEASTFTGSWERPLDGVDNDCDGSDLCFIDDDDDGFGSGVPEVAPATGTFRPCETPGYSPNDEDCSDARADVHPAAFERCDASDTDEDCDGFADDDDDDRRLPAVTLNDPYTWAPDDDLDGYVNRNNRLRACDPPPGYLPAGDTTLATDCDDDRTDIHPGAQELTSSTAAPDGVDQDCDGQELCWSDGDRDGFGDPTATVTLPLATGLCGDMSLLADCDDSRSAINPDAIESCRPGDENCNGLEGDQEVLVSDPTAWYPDGDRDGYGDERALDVVLACSQPLDDQGLPDHVDNHDDCDDRTLDVSPGAAEDCGPRDEDCDGLLNDADPGVTGTLDWYADLDGDGFAPDPTGLTPLPRCAAPDGYVAAPQSGREDCDDLDGTRHPDAREEPSDGLDQDCDDLEACFCDRDGDGAGAPGRYVLTPELSCVDPSGPSTGVATSCTVTARFADNTADCDDGDPANQTEASAWYADADGDGWGVGNGILSCTPPADVGTTWVHQGGDCDDRAPTQVDARGADRHPDAIEVCNDADDDCDDVVDEGLVQRWWVDADGDGSGNPVWVLESCEQPVRYVAEGSGPDCDDTNPAVITAGAEVCNGLDDDCDGLVDDGAAPTSWWPDTDGDGWGAGAPLIQCTKPDDHVSQDGDCDDTNEEANPFGIERCNGFDDNCDRIIDSDAIDRTLWWPDLDGDGATAPSGVVRACTPPDEDHFTASATPDCDDDDPLRAPGLAESCDATDEDCDGVVDPPNVCSQWRAEDRGHVYQVITSPLSRMLQAAQWCTNRNYHLVRIDDTDEAEFVAAAIASSNAVNAWTGYRNCGSTWVWSPDGLCTHAQPLTPIEETWSPDPPAQSNSCLMLNAQVAPDTWVFQEAQAPTLHAWVCEAEL